MSDRLFTNRQKTALYILAEGKCQLCGVALPDDWHADHVIPYSKGGATDVINGQALCPTCNLKKGDKMEKFIPRDWQSRNAIRYFGLNKQNYLLVVTPGGGKTLGTLYIADRLLKEKTVERVIVVVPKVNIKEQWGDDAQKYFDIKLQTSWEDGRAIRHGFDGIVLTYQAVGEERKNQKMLKYICDRYKTLVIFDEIHHASDKKSWGLGIRDAFEESILRISLSGTPFRSDNDPISFVDYDDNGNSKADFPYGYGEGLKDTICRNVQFPCVAGNLEWFDGQELVEADFDDDSVKESQRLRTALDPKNNFIRDFLKEANAELDRIRSNIDTRAGGLVVARDIRHAEKLANILKKIAGEMPVLVHSKIDGAKSNLDSFRGSSEKWLVTVDMASEGVDIPRLRVLAYVTNKTTELYFRQAIGRVVRGSGVATVYIPADKRLTEIAKQIKQERMHAIDEDPRRPGPDGDGDGDGDWDWFDDNFVSIGAEVDDSNNVHISEEEQFTAFDVEEAQRFFKDRKIELPKGESLVFFKDMERMVQEKSKKNNGTQEPKKGNSQPFESETKKVERLSVECNRLAKKITGHIQDRFPEVEYGHIIQRILHDWASKPGNHKAKESGSAEFERKKLWLKEILKTKDSPAHKKYAMPYGYRRRYK